MKESEVISPAMTSEKDAAPLPMYFPISCLKLVLMFICTLGFYEFYWFYKNWCLIKEREKLNIKPVYRTFFAFLFCYSLFKRIQTSATALNIQKSISPLWLAAGWVTFSFILNMLSQLDMLNLPNSFWMVRYFSVLFLLPVQILANDINHAIDPAIDQNKTFSTWNIVALFIGGGLFALTLMSAFLSK